jgi:hypothetical protein
MKSLLKRINDGIDPSFRIILERPINIFRIIPFAFNRTRYSYYKDRPAKSFFRRYWEILVTVWRDGFVVRGRTTDHYYSFGLDCVGTKLSDYVFPGEFRKAEKCINDLNNPFYFNFTDKRVTSIILHFFGLPQKKPLGVLSIDSEGQLQVSLLDGGTISWNELLEKNGGIELFCKPLTGFGGEGAFRITREDIRELLAMNEVVVKRIHELFVLPAILQEVIENHPLIAEIYPDTLNTIRIVTVMKDSAPYILMAKFRMGIGSCPVDNYSIGGIMVAVDITNGKLAKTGNQKPPYGFLHTEHPDTHIAFEGREIPFWDEICGLVVKGHSLLREPHTIGWDIAVTPSGPLIVELNQYPDVDGEAGWRELFDELYTAEIEKLKKLKKRYPHSLRFLKR